MLSIMGCLHKIVCVHVWHIVEGTWTLSELALHLRVACGWLRMLTMYVCTYVYDLELYSLQEGVYSIESPT